MSEDESWDLIDDDTYDEDQLVDEAEALGGWTGRRIGRGLPRPSWPTQVYEIEDARAELTIVGEVALAIRRARARFGLSQREYADHLGVSQSVMARVEAHPESLKLGAVVEVLGASGYSLQLRRETGDGPEPEWTPAELVARDAAGRRPPAHVTSVRTTRSRRWLHWGDPRYGSSEALWTWSRWPSRQASPPERR